MDVFKYLLVLSGIRVRNQKLCADDTPLKTRIYYSFPCRWVTIYKLMILSIISVMPVRYTFYLSTQAFQIKYLVRLIYDTCELSQFVFASVYFATSHFDDCVNTNFTSFIYPLSKKYSLSHVFQEMINISEENTNIREIIDKKFTRSKCLFKVLSLIPLIIGLGVSLFLVPTSASWSKHSLPLVILFSLSGFYGRFVQLINTVTFIYVFYIHGLTIEIIYVVIDNIKPQNVSTRVMSKLYYTIAILCDSLNTCSRMLMSVLVVQIVASATTIYFQFIDTNSNQFWVFRNSIVTFLFFSADLCLFISLNYIYEKKQQIQELLQNPDLGLSISSEDDTKRQLVFILLSRLFEQRWLEFRFGAVRMSGFNLTFRVISLMTIIGIFIRTGVLKLY